MALYNIQMTDSKSAVELMMRDWDSYFDWKYRNRTWIYRLGFHYLHEYECIEGVDIGTAHIPSWAKSSTAGVIGTWKMRRKRLYWERIPLWLWRTVDE